MKRYILVLTCLLASLLLSSRASAQDFYCEAPTVQYDQNNNATVSETCYAAAYASLNATWDTGYVTLSQQPPGSSYTITDSHSGSFSNSFDTWLCDLNCFTSLQIVPLSDSGSGSYHVSGTAPLMTETVRMFGTYHNLAGSWLSCRPFGETCSFTVTVRFSH